VRSPPTFPVPDLTPAPTQSKLPPVPPTDPIDEADEESFPASDPPASTGTHAGPPPPPPPLRILVDIPPGSPDEAYFRTALARFDGRVAITYATGAAFTRALPEANVIVTGDLTNAALSQAPHLRWLSSVAAGLDDIATRPSSPAT
jgi:hypothetical protein